ncbi:MAG: AI-2E family transporter [Planctomycetota bacterium]|nr:AI-2E family transporter [Planctomycetota bacterium]
MSSADKSPRLVTLAACVLVIAALYWARSVLMPFALALLLSFLLAPLVLRLQRWHFARTPAVATAVLLVLGASSALGWLVLGEVRDVAAGLSESQQNVHDKLSALRAVLSKPLGEATRLVTELGAEAPSVGTSATDTTPIQTVRIAEATRGPFEVLQDALGPTFDLAVTAGMAFLFAAMMLLRRDDLSDRFIRIVGKDQILATTRALEDASKRVSRYLWHLMLLNSVHGLAVGIGLSLIGVPNAWLWGVLAAALRFIPYIGPWVSAILPLLASLAGSPGWTQPLLTLGLFVLLELISNNLLEPWIYAAGTGISPLAILIAALFWAWLWGPIGLVLSTPLTVCLVVMGRYVPQFEFLHLLFGDAPGLSPPSRLYQRLIAGDQLQVWVVLSKELERSPLQEVYDAVVLPALSMAEQDRQRGALDPQAEALIDESMRLLLEEAGEQADASVSQPRVDATRTHADALHVLCIPAGGAADALAATMLRQVLERDGVQVEVASTVELPGETLESIDSRQVDLVCISALPPSRFMHLRYLCKRLKSRYPDLPIIAGVWTLEPEAQALVAVTAVLPGVSVVTSLREARERVRQHGPMLRSSPSEPPSSSSQEAEHPALDAGLESHPVPLGA